MELQIIVIPPNTPLYTNTEISSNDITSLYVDTMNNSMCYSSRRHLHLANARTDEEIRYIEQLVSIDPKACFFDGMIYVDEGRTKVDIFHPQDALNDMCSIEDDEQVTFNKFIKKRVNDYLVNV